MQDLQLDGWHLVFDRDATVKAYVGITTGGADSCSCDPCRNWAASRSQLLPREFLELLEHLGVRPDREIEVYHNARLESGLHSYGGWYHFVGRLVGEQDEHPAPLSYGPFLVYFSRNLALVPSAFAGLPTVQLEFLAEVTWLSEIAETY